MPIRKAAAQWGGSIKEGNGRVKTETGAVDADYSFSSRFEDGKGSNPEEILGAAHAGCFSMALSLMLGEEGYTPDSIQTRAEVKIEQQNGEFAISGIGLFTEASVPNIEDGEFQKIAEKAKAGCPVSQALAGTDISLAAKLSR
jgi:osmotically inducible protein OsmC